MTFNCSGSAWTIKHWCALSATMLCLTLAHAPAAGSLLTFEKAPDGSEPVDNASLTTPYDIPGGTVRFYFDVNGNGVFDAGTDLDPVFEHAGVDEGRGFASNFNFSEDTARPGYEDQLGSYFLRSSAFPFGAFIAQYDTSVSITALSGEIWDIDGVGGVDTEQWQVDVLDHDNHVLATVLSPVEADYSASSLDSLPWVFQFHDLPDGVEKLRVTFVGNKQHGVGFAFNNFSPDVPEPSSFVLATVAACGWWIGLRRSRRKPRGSLVPPVGSLPVE